MKILTKVFYNRRKRLKVDGTASVEIEAYHNRKRVYLNSGISIEPKNWSVKQCKIVKLVNADHLNAVIGEVINSIERYEQLKMEHQEDVILSDLRDFILNDKDDNRKVHEFCEVELDRSNLGYASLKRNRSVIKTFKKLMGDITVVNFSYESILRYDNLLRTEHKVSSNTIIGHHKVISKFLNIAYRQEIIKRNPYNLFKIGTEKSNREALTFEEVAKLEKLKIPIAETVMTQVRDMFLFSCYTGLRYSDMQSLSVKDMQETKKGLRINFKMQKVDRAQTLPLYSLFNGKPEAIVQKYISPSNETIFPSITNQGMNRALKNFALAIGTNVKLSSHIARHTFGTMLADITQNPYLIMQLMGHRDIKTSMIYIHLSQSRLEKQLDAVDWDV